MSRWFRHYAGMMRDDKLVRAALRSKQTVERVVWVWGVILESAAEIDDEGRYELDHAEVAYFLRSDDADIAAIESALGDLGRVHEGRVAKWSTRQYQNDRTGGTTRGSEKYIYFIGTQWGHPVKIGVSKNPWARLTEFQTGHPDKLKVLASFRTDAVSEVDIHHLLVAYRVQREWFSLPTKVMEYVRDIPKKANYDELVDGLRSLLRSTTTETEADLDTELKQREKKETAQALELEFENQFWPDFPNKVGRPAAVKSFRQARRSHSLETILAGLRSYVAGKPADRPWLNPATFLNQERFADQPASVASGKPGQGGYQSPVVDPHAGKSWMPDKSETYREWLRRNPGITKNATTERGGERGAWLPPLPEGGNHAH